MPAGGKVHRYIPVKTKYAVSAECWSQRCYCELVTKLMLFIITFKLPRHRYLVKSKRHNMEVEILFIYCRCTGPWELQCSREYKKFLKSISMQPN